MLAVGITGGIGAGKSVVSEIFHRAGYYLIDTDLIARKLVEPGSETLEEIRRLFGNDVMEADGSLSRGRLAQIVFEDAVKRKQLEGILHPKIRGVWQREVQVEKMGGHKGIAVVIPLLYETGAEKSFDKVICVGCSKEEQQKRLLGRGWSLEHLKQRLSAQWEMAYKMDRADYVVWNNYSLPVCFEQVERIIGRLVG